MMKQVMGVAVLSLGLVAAAAAQVKLEIKYPEGQKSTVVSGVKINQTLSIAGMDIDTKVDATTTADTLIGARRPNGTVPIQETVRHVRVHLEIPGTAVDFDSDKPAKAEDPVTAPFVEAFQAAKGVTYTIVVDPSTNKVTAVEGTEKIAEKVPPAAAPTIKQAYSPDSLRQAAEMIYSVLPAQPVKNGDRWTRSEVLPLGGGQTLTMNTHYEYQGTVERAGKTLDKIGIFIESVKYAIGEDSPIPLKVASSDLKVMNSTGTLLFDRERGSVAERTTVTRIAGPIVFDVNGMQIPGNVDLTMDMSQAIK